MGLIIGSSSNIVI